MSPRRYLNKFRCTETHLNWNSSRKAQRIGILEEVASEVKVCFRRFAIKPTLAGNKRQTIKARVHANVYSRQNNNNSGANPPFGPPSCTGRKAPKERVGGVWGTHRRHGFKKGENERIERGRVVAELHAERACVCVALSSPRAFRIVRFIDETRRRADVRPRRGKLWHNTVERSEQ